MNEISSFRKMDLKLKKNHLLENFISLGLIQGVNYILPLVTIPFLFNQLGVEKYGLVNFSFAFIQYFMMLTDFGFGLSGTRYIAENRDDHDKVNRFLNSATLSRLCFAVLSFGILVVCIFSIPKFSENKFFTILFFGQVIGNVFNPSWFFQGMERMKFNTFLHITTKMVSILPLFFVVRKPEDCIYIPIFYSLGSVIAGICSLILIKKQFKMKFFFTSVEEIIKVSKDSGKYFLSRLSVSLFSNTNSFILGLACGYTAVGYYSLAEKIYIALNSIYGPINGAIFPYMTKNKNLVLFKKILFYSTCGNIFLLVCFYIIFPYICPLIFDSFTSESMNVLYILFFANLISLPTTFLGYPFLAAWGHPDYCNLSLVATSVFHIAGIIFLLFVGNVSIYSVAIMVVLSELFLLIYRIYGVKKFHLWKNGLSCV